MGGDESVFTHCGKSRNELGGRKRVCYTLPKETVSMSQRLSSASSTGSVSSKDLPKQKSPRRPTLAQLDRKKYRSVDISSAEMAEVLPQSTSDGTIGGTLASNAGTVMHGMDCQIFAQHANDLQLVVETLLEEVTKKEFLGVCLIKTKELLMEDSFLHLQTT